MQLNQNKIRFIGIDLSLGTYDTFLEGIAKLAASRTSSYVCVANVHMLVEANKSCQISDIVNQADLVTPDGMPLAKGLQILYGIRQDRVAGMDLLPSLLKVADETSIPVFFYGGTDEMLQRTKEYCNQRFSNLQLVGLVSPPFRELSFKEEEQVVKQINSSGARFVFVALGCPKQEKWMASMKGRINACMIGIGGALPVMVGLQSRAPEWMQKTSLEWLYRLIQEPRRLFRRYLITNSIFVLLFLQALLSKTGKTK